MSESTPHVVEPVDPEIVSILEETCKSYQSFLRAFVKWLAEKRAEGSLQSWEGPGVVGWWLTYLLLLSYDVAFVTVAILREGIDRQLLVMKRQALEYVVRALYLVRHPEKAQQQYDALPLKLRTYFEKMDPAESGEAYAAALEMAERAASALPPGAGPTYGETSMFDMLVDLYPDDYRAIYAREYWWPSAIMHGQQVGMLDALLRYGDGKVWMSHNSMTSTRTGNVVNITQSVLQVLLLTGDTFQLRGTHWVALVERFNSFVRRSSPDSKIFDLPLDGNALRAAAAYKPTSQDGTSRAT